MTMLPTRRLGALVAVTLLAAIVVSAVLAVSPVSPGLAAATAVPISSTSSTHLSTVAGGLSTELSTGRAPSTRPVAAASPNGAVAVSLSAVTPVSDGRGPLVVSGVLVNHSATTLNSGSVTVDLALHQIVSRDGLADLRDNSRAPAALSYPRQLASIPLTAPVAAGATLPFSITVAPTRLGSTTIAVYPLRVAVIGTLAGAGGGNSLLGVAYSVLTWTPPSARPRPTPVATVVTLADRPRPRADGVLTDNGLAALIAPTGRLYRIMAAVLPTGGQAPAVTLAVDPTLVQTLRIMAAGPYRVASPAGPRTLPRSADAANFLSYLRLFGAAHGDVVALPYGDVDLVALRRAGSLHAVREAILTGQVVLTAVLGHKPDTAVAVPADGLIDAATIELLRQPAIGISTVIADSRLVRIAGSTTSATPGDEASFPTAAGPVRVLAADAGLNAAAAIIPGSAATGAAASIPAAGAAFLAEEAMITAQRPSVQRPQTLVLPRYWDPPPDWAQTLLGSVATTFSTPVGLTWAPTEFTGAAAVGSASSASSTPSAPAATLSYPDWAAARELPAARVAASETLRTRIEPLRDVLCAPADPLHPTGALSCENSFVNELYHALTNAESVAWRASPAGADALTDTVAGDLLAIVDNIQVVASHAVTLTTRRGTVPVTVENNTDHTITVVLAVSSASRSRLRSPDRMRMTVPPRQKIQQAIDVDAGGAGTFPLSLSLLTSTGGTLSTGNPERILVKSTAVGMIAVAATVGAIGLLVLAVILRIARRIRAARRERDAETPAPVAAGAGAQPLGDLDIREPGTTPTTRLGLGGMPPDTIIDGSGTRRSQPGPRDEPAALAYGRATMAATPVDHSPAAPGPPDGAHPGVAADATAPLILPGGGASRRPSAPTTADASRRGPRREDR